MEFNQDIELIEALGEMYPNSKRNTLRKMLTSGRVSIDGEIVHKAKFILKKGKKVIVSDRSVIERNKILNRCSASLPPFVIH